jgi:hypothetical protein
MAEEFNITALDTPTAVVETPVVEAVTETRSPMRVIFEGISNLGIQDLRQVFENTHPEITTLKAKRAKISQEILDYLYPDT